MLNYRKLISLFFLIIAFIAIAWFLQPLLTDKSLVIEETYNDSHVMVMSDHQNIVWPFESCVTVSWETDNIAGIYLSEIGGIIGWGERQLCDSPSKATFHVIFPDETEKDYKLSFHVVSSNDQIFLSVIIVLSLLSAIVSISYSQLLAIITPLLKVVEEIYTRLDKSVVVFRQNITLATQNHPLVTSLAKYGGAIHVKLAPYMAIFFGLMMVGLLLFAMSYRAYVAFTTQGILAWDETYYASIASTGAHGLGIYPYVQGYPPIPFQGGVGVGAYLYVIAYQIFGPNIWGLRLVSLLASIVGLAGIFTVTRKWYGMGTALVSLAITPYLMLFMATNSIRMDAITFAHVAWALVVFALAWERKNNIYWQVITGFVFALGLQAHIHTLAAAIACGLVYLVDALKTAYDTRQVKSVLTSPMMGYVAGYALGSILFVVITILPDPEAFFRTAGLARLGSPIKGFDSTHTWDSSRLLQSFLSPVVLIAKEQSRYTTLANYMPDIEKLFWALALFALFITRRNLHDAKLRILFIGSIIGNAIILNGTHPIYLTHSLPILLLPLAPLITHGFRGTSRKNLRQVSMFSWLILLILFAIIFSNDPFSTQSVNKLTDAEPVIPASTLIEEVKAIASPDCHIAGDPGVYIPYFLQYPRFTGTRDIEVVLGSSYYGMQDEPIEYWKQKQPDLIFGNLGFGLDKYVEEMQYLEVFKDIWVQTNTLSRGCVLKYSSENKS